MWGLLLAFLLVINASVAQAAPYTFGVDLSLGSSHPDVLQLQRFLNANAAPVASDGPGSPGNETTVFGPRTRTALSFFQEQHAEHILHPLGLTRGTGNFFSATRAFVNAQQTTVADTVTEDAPQVRSRRGGGRSGGGGSSQSAPTSYSIGGSVSGLSGTVVLQNNGADDLTLTSDGSFTFSTLLSSAATYLVSIFSHPESQLCDSSANSGVVSDASVTSVSVNCYNFPSVNFSNYTGFFTNTEFLSPEGDIELAPSSDSAGAFTFVSSNSSVGSILGNMLELNGIGTTTVTAYQATSSPYAATSVSRVFQIYVDACRSEPCLNGGMCTNMPPTDFMCSCEPGFSGTLCDEYASNCDGSGIGMCMNGGTCMPDSGGGSCSCTGIFEGEYCQTIKPSYSLVIQKTGGGTGTITSSPSGISCGSTCTAYLHRDTEVTLTATPGPGATFTGWSGGGCSGTGTCVHTVSDDVTITASFITLFEA